MLLSTYTAEESSGGALRTGGDVGQLSEPVGARGAAELLVRHSCSNLKQPWRPLVLLHLLQLWHVIWGGVNNNIHSGELAQYLRKAAVGNKGSGLQRPPAAEEAPYQMRKQGSNIVDPCPSSTSGDCRLSRTDRLLAHRAKHVLQVRKWIQLQPARVAHR
ncbi:hypothetical protein EYF80_007720 [Liparis tanakae]|uniref:Uncharacterized protein n=1 Tax=Liparis tanakae TaxID=230148 RepID=A0A4Z2IWZ9_9TELE|nr:hypothetical protein EYF80_007720 [Liparis tanakae]